MLRTAKVMAFVATKDPARARAFYEGVLGLPLTADDPSALVFDARGTMLRVQKVQAVTPAPYTALGWEVPDIRAAVEALIRKGVPLVRFTIPGFSQDELGVWTAGDGTKVAWFKDPDGNTLSLTQF